MGSEQKVSIIIPSYNGYHLLKKNLPPLYQVIKKELPETEIIIVDDTSSDDTVSKIKELGFDLKIVSNPRKSSFAASCNNGAQHAAGNILFFLNNDMLVQDSLLPSLVSHFKDDDIFAVAPSSMIKDGQKMIDEIPTIGVWEKGLLYIHQFDKAVSSYNYTLFHASGGCLCVRADRFCQLGGFDEMFSPFYFEDIDLCWRAKKHGWKILHESSVKLLHESHATIDILYSPFESNAIYWKNYFMFIWKNINDKDLLNDHADNLTANLFHYARHEHAILSGFKMALRLFSSKKIKSQKYKISDKELLHIKG